MLITYVDHVETKEKILSLVLDLWHDTDPHVVKESIKMFLAMYAAGVTEVRVAFQASGETSILNRISKLMNNETFGSKVKSIKKCIIFRKRCKSCFCSMLLTRVRLQLLKANKIDIKIVLFLL